MRIIFVEGCNFGKRLAEKANAPYVSIDPFIAAVSDAKLSEVLAAKLATAMLKQVQGDTVIFGIEVGQHTSAIKEIISVHDNCAYVQVTDTIDQHFAIPTVEIFDAVDIISGALSLIETPAEGGALENA